MNMEKKEGQCRLTSPKTEENEKYKFEGSLKANVLIRPNKSDVLIPPVIPHFNIPQFY